MFVGKPHPFPVFFVKVGLDLLEVGVLLDVELGKMGGADMEENEFEGGGLRDFFEGDEREGLSLVESFVVDPFEEMV